MLQWLPYRWHYQAIYLVYRWFLVLYFLSWLIMSGVKNDEGPKYLVFLTHWGFITFNTYLLIAALSSTTKYLSVHFVHPERTQEDDFSRADDVPLGRAPSGCCGRADNRLSWYQMLQWFFFTLGNEPAFLIFLLYWALINQNGNNNAISINVHLVNGVVAVADVWISGVPVNLLHIVYLEIFSAIYVLFSGIYYAISGEVIYEKVLDYGQYLGLAVGVSVGVILVVVPLAHVVVFWLQYLLRSWLQHHCPCYSRQPAVTILRGGGREGYEELSSPTASEQPQYRGE